jgi:archaellum component FlaC
MQLEDETEDKPLDMIDRAIQQSAQELKRLSELYRLRGKSRQAQQIDETLERLARRSETETQSRIDARLRSENQLESHSRPQSEPQSGSRKDQ